MSSTVINGSTFTSRHRIKAIKAETRKAVKAAEKAKALTLWKEEMLKLDAVEAENDPHFQHHLSLWEAEQECGGWSGLKFAGQGY